MKKWLPKLLRKVFTTRLLKYVSSAILVYTSFFLSKNQDYNSLSFFFHATIGAYFSCMFAYSGYDEQLNYLSKSVDRFVGCALAVFISSIILGLWYGEPKTLATSGSTFALIGLIAGFLIGLIPGILLSNKKVVLKWFFFTIEEDPKTNYRLQSVKFFK